MAGPPPLIPTPGPAGKVPFALAGGDTAAVWAVSLIRPGPDAVEAPAPVLEDTVAPPAVAGLTGPPMLSPADGPPVVAEFVATVVVVVVSPDFEQAAVKRLQAASAAPAASEEVRRGVLVIRA